MFITSMYKPVPYTCTVQQQSAAVRNTTAAVYRTAAPPGSMYCCDALQPCSTASRPLLGRRRTLQKLG